jgi:PAS domain S-box-containing protein
MKKQHIYRAALVYAVVSLLYITFSDSVVYSLWPEPGNARLVSTLKGWGFVILTALLLAGLLLRLAARESNRYRALLDNHHAVMLVVDTRTSRLIDVSVAAERFYGWSRAELIGRELSTINTLTPAQIAAEMQRARDNQAPVFHFRHLLASGEIRDVDVYSGPIMLDGHACLLSLVTDVTEQRLAEQELQRQNRLYNLLSKTTQLIRQCTDTRHYYDKLCQAAVTEGGFLFGWVGLADANGVITPVASAGECQGFVDELRILLAASDGDVNSLGTLALREGQPMISNDFLQDPRTTPWHEQGKSIGINAAAAFPFRIGGQFAGTLNLAATQANYFGKKEINTLREVADEISFGLDNLSRITALLSTADVIDTSPVVLFRWRPTTGWPVEFVSSNIVRWGYQASELQSGQVSFGTLMHPGDMDRVSAEVSGFTQQGCKQYQQQYRILTRDGETRWVADNTSVKRDAHGEVLSYQGTLTDITEQHLALESLKSSDIRFRRAIESAPFPIMIHADDGEVLTLNEAWTDLSGYTLADIPTIQAWTSRAYGEQSVVVMDYIDDLYELSERRAEGEYVIQAKDGRTLTWEFSSVGLGRHPDGRRIAISMAFDLTQRKAMELAVQASEAQYRRILENAPDLIFVNRDDAIFYINPAGLKFLQATSAAEVIGRSVYSLFDARFHDNIRDRIIQMRAVPGTMVPMIYESMYALDGSVLDMNVMAVSYQADEHVDILVTCRDISDKRRSEETIADYVKKLEGAVLGTASAVSQMVELRDPYTAGHERRVGELSAAIAAELGLDDFCQQGLRIAGAVHDVGKIVIPTEILTKPSRLSAVEYELLKQHAEQGYEVLKNVDFPWPVAEVARQHHERMDGSGYPRGLKGEEILLEARITAVADVVESMSTHRPYRAALGLEKALLEIEQGAGIRYDADAAAACLRLFREKGYAIPA